MQADAITIIADAIVVFYDASRLPDGTIILKGGPKLLAMSVYI